jgi:hypothetical protein
MANWSNRYRYNESNVDEYVPEEGGVYRLIYKYPSPLILWTNYDIIKDKLLG